MGDSVKRKALVVPVLLIAALTVFSLRHLTAQNSARDYLAPELRVLVDQLKREVETQPTTAQNVAARGMLVWRWMNAYALSGGQLPVNATQQLSAAFVLDDAAKQGTAPSVAANVNVLISNVGDLIYELKLRDEHPAAVPVITASSSGPFAAASLTTFTQTITVGEMPFRVGAKIVLAHMFQSDGGNPQIENPAAGNFVSVRSSNTRVRLAKDSVPWAGMHGGFRGAAPNPAFRVEGDALQPGDQVVLTYGDRSGGSPGMKMPSFSNDGIMYPIYVDLDGQGKYLSPRWPRLNVIGNGPLSVRATAPSVVAVGERFDLAVRSEDDRWNRATGAIPAYEVSLNGTAVQTIPAGTEGLVAVRGLHIDQPGIYRFSVRSTDGKLTATSNPVWAEQSPQQRVYWGETHAHSGFSEGMGSIEAFYKWAREDAALDFGGLSEHDSWLDDAEWAAMNAAVVRYTDPGHFIPFLAYEWTVNRQAGGHHNVFFRSPGRTRVAVQTNYTLSLLFQGLRAKYLPKDVLVIPHAHQAGDWRYTDPDLERLVEIASTHGNFEWFGNYYLQRGAEVGFVGASDDHRTRPGYSPAANGDLQTMNSLVAVRAKAKTGDDIFDAMRDKATYATSDAKRILLDFRVNDQLPGRRITYSADRHLHARVSGTAPLDRLEIIKNGEVIFTRRFAQADMLPASRVEVGFYSSSEAFIRDNPRGYRSWRGYMDVEGAQIAGFEPYFANPATSFVRQDPANPNRIQFRDETRGRTDPFVLELTGVSPSTRLVFHLDQAAEHGTAPVPVRTPVTIPASVVELPFNMLNQGIVAKELQVDRHTDMISAQLVNRNAPLDGELDYADRSNPERGDYYYLRVTQLDGARAWSSPIWVGGEALR